MVCEAGACVATMVLCVPPAELSARLRIFGALDEADERYVNEQFAKVLGVG